MLKNSLVTVVVAVIVAVLTSIPLILLLSLIALGFINAGLAILGYPLVSYLQVLGASLILNGVLVVVKSLVAFKVNTSR